MVREKFDTILGQEISRRDFLKSAGVVTITVIGLPALISSISKAFNSDKPKPQSDTYGGRPYGS